MSTEHPRRHHWIRPTFPRWLAIVALAAASCSQGTAPRPGVGGTPSSDAAPDAPSREATVDAPVDSRLDSPVADAELTTADAGVRDSRDAAGDPPLPDSGVDRTDSGGPISDASHAEVNAVDGASLDASGASIPDAAPMALPDAAPVIPAAGCGSGLVVSGQETIVDAFPTGPGILVVRASAVLLVDRTGQILRQVKMPREVTGAAYDGTRFVVADRGMLTEFRPTLERVASKPLRETCTSVAILPDGRVVCGGSSYVFLYRLDTSAPGRPVDSSGPSFRVVPGTSDLIEGASLVRYSDSGPILQAFGDQGAKVWAHFAFKGSPATHVVATDGALLRITGPGCTLTNPGAPGCFTPDGNLNTLRPQEGYVGLVEDSPTSALALVRKMPVPYPPHDERACAAGCFAQRIDLNQRKIVSEKQHTLDGFVWKRLRADPHCRKLMVLSRTVEEPRFDFEPEKIGDYRVQLLDYGAPEGTPLYPAGGLPPLPPDPEPTYAPAGPACAEPRTLTRSDERILDIHAAPEGVIVVKASGLTLVDRLGMTKAEVKRPVLATAFDGSRLLASDQKVVTIYDGSLVQTGQFTVAEPCSGLIFLGGDRIVCGGELDYNRVFYTYDLQSKAELTRSQPYTYGGLYMTRVPGVSSFITVTPPSGNRYTLFDIDAVGKATVVNEGAYLFQHFASPLFAFLGGNASTHIVDQSARILRIRDAECGAMQNTGHFQQCFEADGMLGNLRYGERMLGVASDGDANVYGVVAPRPVSVGSDTPCAHGCAVQRIDVSTRRIVSQRPVANLMIRYGLRSRLDTTCGMLLLLYQEPPGSTLGAQGFAVDLLDYRSAPGAP